MPISASCVSLRACPAGQLRGPIAGLVFDAGDVLYDATVWRRWLLQLLARLGMHTNYRCFYHVWDHEYLLDVHRGRRDFCDAFRQFLLAVGLSSAQIDEVERACHGRRNQWLSTVRLLPGVRSTVARLRALELPMTVLSDSEYSGDTIRQRLDRLGLKDAFAGVISSIDLGHTKPEPQCYQAALDVMGVDAAEAVFVGHDTVELRGATEAGMQTVAFNFSPDAEADVFLARIEELVDLVIAGRADVAAG